jgi:YggT family protein
MNFVLALTRGNVADYVSAFIAVYTVLIIVKILLSWFRLPYNRWLNAFLEFVDELTNPYLNIFRRWLPLVRIGPGALDISPIVAIIVLSVVGGIVVRLIRG